MSSRSQKQSSKHTPSASLFSVFSIGEYEKKKTNPNWTRVAFFPVKMKSKMAYCVKSQKMREKTHYMLVVLDMARSHSLRLKMSLKNFKDSS